MKRDLEEKGEGGSEKKSTEALHMKVARAESDDDDEHIHLFMAQMLQEQKAEVAERWIVDSGASSSMTSNCEWLENYRKLSKPKKVCMGDERYIYAVGIGQVKITMHQKAIYLVQNVYYVPDLNGNLLSVSYLVNHKYHVHFLLRNTRPAVEINDPDGYVIAYGHEENGLFIFDGTTCLPEECANITILSNLKLVNDSVEEKMDEPPQKKSTGSLTTWHKCLGHIAKATVKKLSKKQMVKGMEIDEHDDEDETHQCSTCLKGKMTWQPIPKVSDIENPRILHRIYSNICGPMQKMTQDGHRYFMTFIDGHSRYIKVELLKTKDEAVEKLIALIEHAEVETGEWVNYFQSDGGGEYSSGWFAKYLKSKGIHHEFTNSDTPQENGIAERANRTLVHTAWMMLFESSLSRSFWGYTILYTTHILNRVINRGVSTKKTPYHLYTGSRPSVTHLRSFGCGVQVLLTGVKDKLASCSVRGVFIGLSENKKAYIIHDRSTGKTHISRDMVFYEGGQVRPSEFHVTIPDSEESDEEIDITVNAGPDLKAS